MAMAREPSISIILPIYNCEQYLDQCIISIIEQTNQDYELLLIDDGSTDKSPEICDKFAKDYPKIKVLHKQNEGVSVARNIGIKASSGEWIMFVDSDDFLEPSILEELFFVTNEDTDIVSCCCNVFSKRFNDVDYFFDEDKIFSTYDEKKELYFQLLNNSYGQPYKVYTAIGVPWGKLYRRSFLEENNLFFKPEMKRLQDNLFNMYSFYFANEIKYINKPLYNYRYDHIKNFYKKNPQEIINIFHTVAKERYICLSQFGLLNDTEIRNNYKLSVLKNIIDSIQYAVFLNENLKQIRLISKRKNLLNEIRNLEYFDKLFNEANINDFKHLKHKISFSVLKNKRYVFFYLMFCFDNLGKTLEDDLKI